MTATQRAAMQQALEFCEELQGGCTDSDDGTVEAITVWCPEVIAALRAALAEPEPEPAAKVRLMTTGGNVGLATRIVEIYDPLRERLRPGQLLYTTPPARQPLTDDQRGGLVMEHLGPAALTGGTMSVYDAFLAGLSAAERAHGIKESK